MNELEPTQPRRKMPESLRFWRAVRALRRQGHRVYRAGRDDSLVDGRRTPNRLIEEQGR
jgi:hypothetical protein